MEIPKEREVKEINKAGEIASFYGFKPLVPPTVSKKDFDLSKNFDQNFHPSERVSLYRIYFEEKMMALPQPCMFYCERPFPGFKENNLNRKSQMKIESSLISLGSTKSVCECLSIQAAVNILNACGYKNLEILINSVGDKDSFNEFQRKMTAFLKKNMNSFPSELRQAIKKDPFVLLKENREEWKNWMAECPKSIDFLSEQSRIHFKEVLEFLEIIDIPYAINNGLIGDPEISSESVFKIFGSFAEEKKEELSYGFRSNRMGKKIGLKKELPSTILSISARLKKPLKRSKPKKQKHLFYLVQFGMEAKMKSFIILKELYRAGVSVAHSIAKDKLSSQIGSAENSGIPYIILIGQKEALENSVVIRNNLTRAQEIVPIPQLYSKIKEMI